MSYPYPQDRSRDQREKGDQPYKENKEAIRQQDEALQRDAEFYGEHHRRETDDERDARLKEEATDRLRRVTDEIREEQDLP